MERNSSSRDHDLDAGSALEKPDYSFGKFACHVDLAPDEAPDDCVLNYGVPGDCIYARTASGRVRRSPHTCRYWKRVAPSSAMQTPDEVPGTNPDIGEGET